MIEQLSADIQKIYKDSADALVEVRDESVELHGGRRRGHGRGYGKHGRRGRNYSGSISGVLWEQPGIILTLSHPLEDPDKIFVRGAGMESTPAVVRGWDNRYNLAVLQVEGAPAWKDWAGLESLSPGELVLSRGYNQIRMGMIARTEGSRQTFLGGELKPWVEVDGTLAPGQEGSALLSSAGNILAINSSHPHPLGQSLGYSQLQVLVKNILENGTTGRSYLGITTSEGTSADGRTGLVITSVAHESPAHTAGLVTGDFLIRLADAELAKPGDLFTALQTHDAGSSVKLSLIRSGVEKSIEVTLGRR